MKELVDLYRSLSGPTLVSKAEALVKTAAVLCFGIVLVCLDGLDEQPVGRS
jgi:hypothetical protein